MKFCTLPMTILVTLLVTGSYTLAQTTARASNSSATNSSAAGMPITETKKSSKSKEVALTSLSIHEDDMVPDIDTSTTNRYHCELNDSLTIYTNKDDDRHTALRWKNRLYRLSRVETTTGADRFENKKAGLVWIGIPTKGMLLDSKHGEQLANECKTIP